jgi:hypothetical protein
MILGEGRVLGTSGLFSVCSHSSNWKCLSGVGCSCSARGGWIIGHGYCNTQMDGRFGWTTKRKAHRQTGLSIQFNSHELLSVTALQRSDLHRARSPGELVRFSFVYRRTRDLNTKATHPTLVRRTTQDVDLSYYHEDLASAMRPRYTHVPGRGKLRGTVRLGPLSLCVLSI